MKMKACYRIRRMPCSMAICSSAEVVQFRKYLLCAVTCQGLCWLLGISQFSHWVISNSFRPHGLQPTRLFCPMSAILWQFEHFLALPFFGIGMKTDLFQSTGGHCWVFQICWHIVCSTFTASSFKIWNSSTGIPSPPLALFIVMLPKAHLTSHSRMSGSRWVYSWFPMLC